MTAFLPVFLGLLFLNIYNVSGSINLALGQNARQSSTFTTPFPWDAERAVDGLTGTFLGGTTICAITNIANEIVEAWWQVDLGQTSFVKTVRILIPTHDTASSRSHLAGYSLFISDSPDILSGQLCYNNTGDALPPVDILRTCNMFGRYVTIYNRRSGNPLPGYSPNCTLFICEVQANGCPVGKYGNQNCDIDCSTNCVNDTLCDPDDGTCTGGCNPGWQGLSCDSVCDSNTYGPGCMLNCTGNCLNGTCDHVTGLCPGDSCNAGYKSSPNCSEVCDGGTFGFGCRDTCYGNCLYEPCNHINGSCPYGKCIDGWLGDKCDIACDNGTYGQDCAFNCPASCVNESCHHVNGQCLACKDGYKGFNCTQECDPGTFGPSCVDKCSVNCLYQPCHMTNGTCPFGKCTDGWLGSRCNEACQNGFYGDKCNSTCGNCANQAPCNHVTGNCPGSNPRCEIGWGGSRCKTECGINTFGADCTGRCGRCLNASTCNVQDGSCPYGCEEGWEGQSCEISTASIGQGAQIVENAGIIFGASAGVLVLILMFGAIIVLKRKQKPVKGGNIRRLKSSYVTFDEDSTSIANPGSKRMKRRSRGDNLEFGLGKEGTGKICDDSKRVSHYICDLYAVVDKPKSSKDKHIIVIRNQHKRNSSINRTSQAKLTSNASEPEVEKADDFNIYNEADEIIRETISEESIYDDLTEGESSKSTENLVNAPGPRTMSISSKKSEGTPAKNLKDTPPQEQNPYFDMSSSTFSKTSIKIEDIKTIIYQKLTEKTFDEEYQSLPEGDLHPHEVGSTPENKPKNRFVSVLPYDHSRVKLEPLQIDPASTDYINANYIDGVNESQIYIATQGPKKSTIRDFWRMIWQKQVGKIVMVTDFIEAGKVKCAKYWLEPGINMKISIYVVTVEEEREYAFYTARKIKLVDTQSKKVRRVNHFHFTMWPDHGTPDPLQLVLFQQKVFKEKTKLTGPMVVHCSAGLGRTGTFIGLDALLSNGWKTGFVDVFEYVKKMRQNRTNMVQTADQYFIIHRALLEGFRLKDTMIIKDLYLSTWEEMQKEDKPANRKKIRDEFQKLDYLRPEYDESMFTGAHLEINTKKNRSSTVLTVDRYRPFLTTPVTGRNDYINAVMIPSFTKPVGYLVTQFPLPDTVVDIWRLLFDHDSSTIVSLGAIENIQQQNSSGSSDVAVNFTNQGPFTVKQCSKKIVSTDISEIEFTVTNTEMNVCKEVTLYEVKVWKAGEPIPPSKNLILSLAELTENKRKQSNSGPITIMCPDGAVCSGILCAFCNSVERLEVDNEIDIFQTVRQLQIRRPEFVQKLEQYSYCYDLLKEYLYPRDMYANT